MNRNRISPWVALLSLSLAASLMVVQPAYSDDDNKKRIAKLQEQADRYFKEEKYARAERKYADLAKVGDYYSQYRLSVIKLLGLNDGKHPAEAFAWAELAAQSPNEQLQVHRDQVWNQLSESEQIAGGKLAIEYLQEWSDHAIARRELARSKDEMRRCTGSRLGTSCEQVYSSGLPRGVEIGGGAPVSGAQGRAGGGNDGQSVGGESRNVAYYQELRDAVFRLEQKLNEIERGDVQLGEFRVIEPGSEEESPDQTGDSDAEQSANQPD